MAIGGAVSVQPMASDPDPGDVLAFSLPLAPAGMTMVPATGAIAWTPGAAQLGVHDATVEVRDARGLVDFTSFVVTVAAVNEMPLARDDAYNARVDEVLSVAAAEGVLANDEDPNGDPLTAALVEPPALGTVDLATDGSFEYTPAPPVFGGTEPVLFRDIQTTTTNDLTYGVADGRRSRRGRTLGSRLRDLGRLRQSTPRGGQRRDRRDSVVGVGVAHRRGSADRAVRRLRPDRGGPHRRWEAGDRGGAVRNDDA